MNEACISRALNFDRDYFNGMRITMQLCLLMTIMMLCFETIDFFLNRRETELYILGEFR